MLNPRLASRYAKSLIDLAVEQNSLEETLKDVQLMDATIRGSQEFASVLKSPIIKADKKDAIIDQILGPRMSTLTRSFVKLLTTKGREGTLGEMATSFLSQYRLMKRISQVRLITAAPVSEEVKENIRRKVSEAMPGQSIELSSTVEPDLIGGFVLELGDKLVDASIRRDLNDIKKHFLKNLYVSELR